jgi:hypothetical protein
LEGDRKDSFVVRREGKYSTNQLNLSKHVMKK